MRDFAYSFNGNMAMEATVCGDKLGNLILELAKNFAIYIGMVIACNGLHLLLKPYKQPRITSDIIVSFLSLQVI
ncbi:hypothetical protein JHK84_027641 [Glycine max]|nr:hypothetical protein JHK84_027641 [Glycine max]